MNPRIPTAAARLGRPAAALALLALAACADLSGIESRARLREPASLGLPAGARTAAPLAADWWRDFGDAQLDALVAQALEGNPGLRLAQARLARAQAVTAVADAARLPQLNASLDLTRQKYTAHGAVPAPLAGAIRDSGQAQLSLGWELDFFGKYGAALDAALGSARAAEAEVQAARLLLASNLVRQYIQLARLQAQIAVAERTLAQREQTLGLVRERVEAGLDTNLELRQSEASLPEARQQLEALREQGALTRHALAALVGDPAVAQQLQPAALAALQGGLPANEIPADLLGRRADVAAARWRVEAAGHEVANAKAQFYPNINLVAFAGLSSIGLGRLLDAGSQQWGVGPALRLPIFEAGRLRANLRGKAADYDAAVESYNATVLEAVRETADQLASAQSIARQQAEQGVAQAAAESAYEIAVQRYRAGLGNYLQVLSAETSVLQQRRLAVDLAARALDARVGLIRALGGGYEADAAARLAMSTTRP